jgi:hypothetical protein
MKKTSLLLTATVAVFAMNSAASAHDPPDFLGGVWQWPENALPVLDGDLSEWEVIPSDLWITEQDVVQSNGAPSTYSGDLDVSSIAFRWTIAWNEETNRTYHAFERFDDIDLGAHETYEVGMDADHAGGFMWDTEGMTDEEKQRARGRNAQPYHYAFDEGFTENWSWFWMTAADWYRTPEYTDNGHRVEGVSGSGGETRVFAEWYNVWWDDFNWEDPNSPQHDFEVDEIVGWTVEVFDIDGPLEDDCNCYSRWTLGPNDENFGDADFYPDFILLPVDESADFVTAVEEDSWGRIKASLGR